MATNTYTQHYADGTSRLVRRSVPQGRKPQGLAEPEKFRLYEEDKKRLEAMKENLGYLFNKNEIIRNAVRLYLDNYVPTELLKH